MASLSEIRIRNLEGVTVFGGQFTLTTKLVGSRNPSRVDSIIRQTTSPSFCQIDLEPPHISGIQLDHENSTEREPTGLLLEEPD